MMGVDDLKPNLLMGLQRAGIGGGDLGEEQIEARVIELTVPLVKALDKTLSAPGFGDADLAHNVEALFAKRAAIVNERTAVNVSIGSRRVGGKALGSESDGVAGELVAIHNDDGGRDGMEGFKDRRSIDPGHKSFAGLCLHADIGGEVGVGKGGHLVEFVVGGYQFGREHD